MGRGVDVAFRARRAVTPDGEVAVTVGVRDGRIAAVEPLTTDLTAAEVVELDAEVVLLPGLVDTHVHVNEPGRTDWEGFATATRAAAAGGVTVILDMPLNSIPPTVDLDALAVKRTAADGQCFVDVGFWGGAVPGNLGRLAALHDAGVFGFKCFLLPSGIEEFPPLSAAEVEDCADLLAELGALLAVHAEDAATIAAAPSPRGDAYAGFLRSRPREAESVAVARVIEVARRTAARLHVVHVSSAEVIPMLRSARREGVAVTAETCPHYLFFTADDIPERATQYKCSPPIREAENREQLWAGLAEGTIDAVVSDHSPCTSDLKLGGFDLAWGGISSLQLGLPVVWTEARRRGQPLADVVDWMAGGPAAHVGLGTKGRMAVGCDADLVVFAPDEEFVVEPSSLHHRNPVTPYAGRRLTGVVRETWLRGVRVSGDAPGGRLLTRGAA
ncbi:MAG: allantoinase AllB [Jiangellaceae bacterium]